MQTATIEIGFINPPKAGKKFGSVRSTDGTYYSVPPESLHLFEPGGTYTINYVTTPAGYHNFKAMVPGASAAHAPLRLNGAANGNGHDKSSDMFVMSCIGKALDGAGTIPEEPVLTAWVRTCRAAWKNGNTAVEDEIPY